MTAFLDKLQLVAHEPLTYVAFLILVGAWVWRAYFLRTTKYITSLKTLPKKDQLSGLQLLALGYPQEITKNHLTLLRQRYFLVAFIATLLCIIILAGLLVHYGTSSPETTKHLANMDVHYQELNERTARMEKLLKSLAPPSNSGESPLPPPELQATIKSTQQELASVKAQLAVYRQRFGELPAPVTQAVSRAEAVVNTAERYFQQITLPNAFIDQYRDAATITTNLLIDKVGVIHPPAHDGDLHIAGRAPALGYVTVAELINAKEESEAVALARRAVGSRIPITGVWRFWLEAGGQNTYQPTALLPITTMSNPPHVFEIHPVTSISGISVVRSVHWIDGYELKDARTAFTRFEHLPCEITRTSTTTTVKSVLAGYNYVEFLMEVHAGAHRSADAWIAQASVYTTTGELLVPDAKMVFILGTDAATAAERLASGSRLRVIGMPRLNLAQLATQPTTTAHLPYELVIIATREV